MNYWVMIYRIGWIALAALVVIAVTAMFVPKFKQYHELSRKNTALQDEIRVEEETLKQLKDRQERLKSDPRFVEKLAREELGYAKPGETVFRFTDDEAPASNLPSR
jgi:cell division protein DivIC